MHSCSCKKVEKKSRNTCMLLDFLKISIEKKNASINFIGNAAFISQKKKIHIHSSLQQSILFKNNFLSFQYQMYFPKILRFLVFSNTTGRSTGNYVDSSRRDRWWATKFGKLSSMILPTMCFPKFLKVLRCPTIRVFKWCRKHINQDMVPKI